VTLRNADATRAQEPFWNAGEGQCPNPASTTDDGQQPSPCPMRESKQHHSHHKKSRLTVGRFRAYLLCIFLRWTVLDVETIPDKTARWMDRLDPQPLGSGHANLLTLNKQYVGVTISWSQGCVVLPSRASGDGDRYAGTNAEAAKHPGCHPPGAMVGPPNLSNGWRWPSIRRRAAKSIEVSSCLVLIVPATVVRTDERACQGIWSSGDPVKVRLVL
jgi:hypothetical protein